LSPDAGVTRPPKPEEADDSFMMSYSALMILLLTFMILMVTLANFKEPRFRKAIGSVQGAFSFLPYAGGDDLMSTGSPGFLPEEVLARASTQDVEPDEYDKVIEEIKARSELPDLAGLEVEERDDGLAIRVSDALMFERGSAGLKTEILPVMGLVARAVNLRPGRVSVVGNTCDLPISTEEFPSNWELSILRAVQVLHHLEAAGVDPGLLYAYGLADERPVVPADDEASRRMNRRVEIYVANRATELGMTAGKEEQAHGQSDR